MAQKGHQRKKYPSDLTDEQWAILEPIRNYPEPLSSNCLLHKGIEPFSFFRSRHV
jgi:hypothetical protein